MKGGNTKKRRRRGRELGRAQPERVSDGVLAEAFQEAYSIIFFDVLALQNLFDFWLFRTRDAHDEELPKFLALVILLNIGNSTCGLNSSCRLN